MKDFAPEDKIVNQFEEILRHNNVSDKENAFNRLIALFICKLVDESIKGENDEVEFQYKQGTDTYETLQDRLQRLHKEGMEQFMREEILYVPDTYAENLFANYTGSKRQKAIDDLTKTIRILKFYSNNDFTFKDVHNEDLFYQNGKILMEVVQLFELYRIVYPAKHQFLGDLFEQLLNKGFKQNEGQFFTPIPIARFIWDSLPLRVITHSDKGHYYPKVIDYACGAGHFLTEAVEAINAAIGEENNNAWVRDHIFGVEKDYRLARVSKISLFMNGAGGGNIIFGDGLENDYNKGIENGTFDILVANPPYSVAAFKAHLQLKNNSFELLDYITMNGSEIEVLFVERIAQLLKLKGIAAVILPSSILSNDSASYIGAREQLLQNFQIRAIVQLGGKTFGATNTNTVILFLEKYDEPPKRMDMLMDSVQAILDGSVFADWEDQEIFNSYVAQIEVSAEDYRKFIDECPIDELLGIEYFKMYVDSYYSDTKLRKFMLSGSYLHMSADEQAAEINRRFYVYAKLIEHEKLQYYALTYQQQTLIISAPVDTAGQKEFLGYDWSNRKGAEGIVINVAGGLMYQDDDRRAENTLASAIRQSYCCMISELPAEKQKYVSLIHSCDMFSYSRINFTKAMKLSTEKRSISITSKHQLLKIDDLQTLLKRGKSPQYGSSNIQIIKSGQARGFYQFDFAKRYYQASNETDERKLQTGDVLINSTGVGTAGRVTLFDLDGDYVVDSHITILRCNELVLPKYVLMVLAVKIGFQQLAKMADGLSGQIELTLETIKNIRIPVPPLPVQQQLVADCEKIEEEITTLNETIARCDEQIQVLFIDMFGDYPTNQHGWVTGTVRDVVTDVQYGTSLPAVADGTYPYLRMNNITYDGELDLTDTKLIDVPESDLPKCAVRKGDVLFNRTNSKELVGKTCVYDRDEMMVLAGFVIRVRVNDKVLPEFIASFLNTSFSKKMLLRIAKAAIGQANINAQDMQNIGIYIPPIDLQKEYVAQKGQLRKAKAAALERIHELENKRKMVLDKYLN